MNRMSATQDEIDMKLTQMGGKVTSLHGIISFIHFNFNQEEFIYVYNLNKKNKYFLQMVKPYHVGAGVFSKPQEIVQYIKNDIKQFENASNSHVFSDFVDVNHSLCNIVADIKDVFMTYNVSIDKMHAIEEKIGEISSMLNDIRKTSPHL